ncbi:hypothetical protein [Myxococcus landrumensis]|nr:hypothetical protein [Myxococcus landrumus]
MTRPRQRPQGPHRIHYSPQAWREVGRMSAEDFGALQAALERLGGGMDAGTWPPDEHPGLHVLPRHGLVLGYAWDEASRTLTLLSLERQRSEAP